MADDAGDRTEAPTQRRRTDAAEQGNIARSPDRVTAALLLGVMYMRGATGPGVVKALKALMTEVFSSRVLGSTSSDDSGQLFISMVRSLAVALAPMLIAAM